jgi:hypothetical protein
VRLLDALTVTHERTEEQVEMAQHDATDWAAWQAEFIEQFRRRDTAGRGRPSLSAGELTAARRSEWREIRLGRLGRILLAEVAPYLEFFLIAREA